MTVEPTETRNDSPNVKAAAAQLERAVDALRAAIAPIGKTLSEARSGSDDVTALQEDRRKLTEQLDAALHRAQTAEAQVKALQAEQEEVAALADETMKEIDLVISQVRHALGRE